MNANPNLQKKKTWSFSLLGSFVLLLAALSPSFAAVHHLEIDIPGKIVSGKKASFTVTARTENGAVDSKAKNSLVAFISAPGMSQEHHLLLKNGKANLDVTLSDPQAYLIDVVDEANSEISRSESFRVELDRTEVKP